MGPAWLDTLLKSCRGGNEFWLDSRPNPMNAPQHWITKKPRGHWIMGWLINSKGKYIPGRICVMVSNGDGTFRAFTVKVAALGQLGINSLETLVAKLESDQMVGQGGYHNYSVEVTDAIVAMYTQPIFDDDDEDPSNVVELRSSGGGTHIE